MWSDERLNALEAQATDLTTVLDQYRELLDHYRRLKSDYEEEKESREKYKRLARGQERNPFVLVLVDGDGYIVSTAQCRASIPMKCSVASANRASSNMTYSNSATKEASLPHNAFPTPSEITYSA